PGNIDEDYNENEVMESSELDENEKKERNVSDEEREDRISLVSKEYDSDDSDE
ncbi:10231_t:CDS:1, partial [Funneliformis caledonium]